MTKRSVKNSRRLTSYLVLGSLAICIGWLVVGCDAERGAGQSILNRGINGAPESLDPRMFSSNQSRAVLRDLGEGLVAISADGEVVPGTAESWIIGDDGREYTFRIRESARWSDGHPVSAADFVAAFQRLADPDRPARNSSVISDIRNYDEILEGRAAANELAIVALDQYTLQVRLKNPSATFLQKLTHPATFPIRDHEASSDELRVSNGPYVLANWDDNSLIRLEKSDHYWDSRNTSYDVVNYHIVEESAEYSRYRAGELDVTGNVPASIFDKVREEHPSELRVSPYLGVFYFGFNLDHPSIGDDLELRQALSLAIDRDVIVTKLLGRGELPAVGWVPPGVNGFDYSLRDEHETNVAAKYDRARSLLKASKYASRFLANEERLTLHYNNSDVQKRIAIAIQSMWYDVLGIEVDIVSLDYRVLLSQIQDDKSIQVFRLSWTGDYNDAENFLEVFESHSSSNYTKYKNSAFDELIQIARTETDVSERATFLAKAEQILLADQPVIPLYFYVSKHLVRDTVAGWAPNVLDEHPSKYLRPQK